MCRLCNAALDEVDLRRSCVLQLLALLEHPDALPRGAALRIGREAIAMAETEPGPFRCDAVTSDP